MFETLTDNKTNAPAEPKSRLAEVSLGKHAAGKLNPVWQSLALNTASIQTRLTISQPGDRDEQEADRVADNVMQMASPTLSNDKLLSSVEASPKAQREYAPHEQREGDNRDSQGKEQEATHDSPASASSVVNEVLNQPGQPLDSSTRNFFEPRFDQNFGDVRVHTGTQAHDAARRVDANAFTLGRHVVFRAGQYAPHSEQSKRLLAHELTHVVQQRSAPSASHATLARQTWGTEKTTAPPAKNVSPGDVFRARLKDEVALFAKAGVILDWIISTRAAAGGTNFKTATLLADDETMKKINPQHSKQPTTAADLLPVMQMLEFYKVVTPSGQDSFDIVLAPSQPGQTQQDVNRADFDEKRKDITAFQQNFETRFNKEGHPTRQIAQQQMLDKSLAGGSQDEKTKEKEAEAKLAGVTAEMDEFVAFRKKGKPIFRVTTDSPNKVTDKTGTLVLLPIAGSKKPTQVNEADLDRIEPIRTGKSPEVEARRNDIMKRTKGAEKGLYTAQGFHRFATELVWFLNELVKTSSIKFHAGTYPLHGKFGEYAADMYPSISENSEGFYKIDKAEQFVDDINKVAEAGNPYWGKFAWQIVYNDTKLQTKINEKYGHRMSSAPHHGPAPDKLHMHLDIRPLDVVADWDTGYGINQSGRVSLYK